MSEQLDQTATTTTAQATQTSACQHPEAIGKRWGDPISEERQAELQGYLDRWEADTDHGLRWGPFDLVFSRGSEPFTGADVSWLAEQSGRDDLEGVPNLHLEGADLVGAHLEGADLVGAHLNRAQLDRAHLEGAVLSGAHLRAFLGEAHLEGADLSSVDAENGFLPSAHLEGATLSGAHLKGAFLGEAHLEGAVLYGADVEKGFFLGAHLEGADLQLAHLEGAVLRLAHLEGAVLRLAHLERASLFEAHLEGKTYAPDDPDLARIRRWTRDFPATLPPADLRTAVLDAATTLGDSTLGDARRGAVRVADVRWGGANLAVVDWTPLIEPVTELGDERAAWKWKPTPFKPPEGKHLRQEMRQAQAKHDEEQAAVRLEAYRAAVRANRQLATALRDQGMNEEADQFAYRAQVLQRQVFRQQHKRGRAAFSWLLDRVAGHGYKPQRSLYTYLAVLFGFAVLYFLVGNGLLAFGLPVSQFHDLPWYEALILSVSSFHGRGFFQPVQSLGDPVAILAALEAVFGLFIEVSFIATFTQRFFGK